LVQSKAGLFRLIAPTDGRPMMLSRQKDVSNPSITPVALIFPREQSN